MLLLLLELLLLIATSWLGTYFDGNAGVLSIRECMQLLTFSREYCEEEEEEEEEGQCPPLSLSLSPLLASYTLS